LLPTSLTNALVHAVARIFTFSWSESASASPNNPVVDSVPIVTGRATVAEHGPKASRFGSHVGELSEEWIVDIVMCDIHIHVFNLSDKRAEERWSMVRKISHFGILQTLLV
jgi:hypothetical protein